MEQRNVYFFHIPKTAGVSVWRFLESVFPPEQVCPWWLWDQLITVPMAEINRWHVFRGHFMSYLGPYLGKRLTTFTMLRDPVERTISHYCHVRHAPDHPYHAHALRMSLGEFCANPDTRHMIENFQAGYLARSQCDPVKAARDLSAEQLGCFELQRRMESADAIADPAALLEIAQERLIGFSAVGFTEAFDDSLVDITQSLGFPTAPSPSRQNVNPERILTEEVDKGTLTLIRDLTEIDQRLYEFAWSRFRCANGREGQRTRQLDTVMESNR